MYRNGCKRCEARALARAPLCVVSDHLATVDDEMRRLVDDERALDVKAGIHDV